MNEPIAKLSKAQIKKLFLEATNVVLGRAIRKNSVIA